MRHFLVTGSSVDGEFRKFFRSGHPHRPNDEATTIEAGLSDVEERLDDGCEQHVRSDSSHANLRGLG